MVCLPGCDWLQQGFCKFVGHKIPCYLLIITFEAAAGINYLATINGGVRETFYHWLLSLYGLSIYQRIVIAVPLPPFSLVEREFWCGGIPSVVGQILPIENDASE